MCNRRSATLPAIIAAVSEEGRMEEWLETCVANPLVMALRRSWVGGVLRLRNRRPQAVGLAQHGLATTRRNSKSNGQFG